MAVSRIGSWSSAVAVTLTHTNGAGSNRCMIVCIQSEGGTTPTVASVDYGGQAMTEIIEEFLEAGGNDQNVAVYALLESGIAAASNTTITPTFDNAPAETTIHAGTYGGVDQTGGATTFPESKSDSVNAATPNPFTTIDIDGADGNAVVGFIGTGNINTVSWEASLTEQTDLAGTTTSGSAADALLSADGNVTVEGTASLQNRACVASLEFVASVAPPAPPADDGGPGTVVRRKQKTEMLPDRPTAKTRAKIDSILLTKSLIINKGRMRMPALSMAEAIVNSRLIAGMAVSKLSYPIIEETVGKLKFQLTEKANSMMSLDAWIDKQMSSVNSIIEASSKLTQLLILKDSPILKFDFDEETNNEALTAFTHSSSFVGNVRYNTETQGMTMILNGKEYNFCNVPARVFDSFQGADSKGAFFARSIKGQFNC